MIPAHHENHIRTACELSRLRALLVALEAVDELASGGRSPTQHDDAVSSLIVMCLDKLTEVEAAHELELGGLATA